MRGKERKIEIVKAASKLFKERGFSAVTMRDLAQEMGIKAASLYNHIQSKDEILSLVVMKVAKEFDDAMNSIVVMQATPSEKLKRIIETHVAISIRNEDAMASVNNDWMHLSAPDIEDFMKMRTDYEGNVRRTIQEGIEKGEIRPQDPEMMLFSLLSTLNTLYLWYAKREVKDIDQLTQEMTQILLKGVLK